MCMHPRRLGRSSGPPLSRIGVWRCGPGEEEWRLPGASTRYLYAHSPATPQHFGRMARHPAAIRRQADQQDARRAQVRRAGRRAGMDRPRRHRDAARPHRGIRLLPTSTRTSSAARRRGRPRRRGHGGHGDADCRHRDGRPASRERANHKLSAVRGRPSHLRRLARARCRAQISRIRTGPDLIGYRLDVRADRPVLRTLSWQAPSMT
jgi:hypothetical protein